MWIRTNGLVKTNFWTPNSFSRCTNSFSVKMNFPEANIANLQLKDEKRPHFHGKRVCASRKWVWGPKISFYQSISSNSQTDGWPFWWKMNCLIFIALFYPKQYKKIFLQLKHSQTTDKPQKWKRKIRLLPELPKNQTSKLIWSFDAKSCLRKQNRCTKS